MKLLFISRAYPPVIGGIENQNYELSTRLPQYLETDILVNTKGKKFLLFFLPYAFCKTLIFSRRYDAILFGDGVLSVIGFFVKLFSPKTRILSVIHGLDVTYKLPLYQALWVKLFLPSLDTLIAVSQETKNVAVQHGLEEDQIVVIPNGVDILYSPEKFSRQDLSTLLGTPTEDLCILLTHGRLAKRKGAAWFIREVLPLLPANIHYVVSGSGPETEAITAAIQKTGLETRVHLLGRISEDQKLLLLHTVDIFIQPNIRVAGDMEGFGIAVIEASGSARPVVASNLEGLTEALAGGKNGLLLPPEEPGVWVETLLDLSRNKERRITLGETSRDYTLEHFSWEVIIKQYISTLDPH